MSQELVVFIHRIGTPIPSKPQGPFFDFATNGHRLALFSLSTSETRELHSNVLPYSFSEPDSHYGWCAVLSKKDLREICRFYQSQMRLYKHRYCEPKGCYDNAYLYDSAYRCLMSFQNAEAMVVLNNDKDYGVAGEEYELVYSIDEQLSYDVTPQETEEATNVH